MSKDKKIKVPEMEYWDKAKTKPKFEIGVWGNGSLQFLQHLNEADEKHGLYVTWLENGQTSAEGNWECGKMHGLVTEWYDNGQKSHEGNWNNNEQHGKWTDYDANGQKSLETNYVDGKVHGECNHFDECGKLTKTDIYENDKLVNQPDEEIQPAI